MYLSLHFLSYPNLICRNYSKDNQVDSNGFLLGTTLFITYIRALL